MAGSVLICNYFQALTLLRLHRRCDSATAVPGYSPCPRFYARTGVAFLASWRLGERLSKAAMTENAIAKQIVDAAFRIHTTLGPGLLESVYHAVLAYELAQRGLRTVEVLAPVHKKQLLT